jgi:nucleoside phosphorylase
MTGILIATKSEAAFFLKHLSPVKKDGIYHYRGSISGKNTALYLTRPGVAAKEQLRRFLRLYTFERVVSTGACGNLTSELKRHDVVPIANAAHPAKKNIVIAQTGRTAVSVEHLVTTDNAKADLRAQTGADIIDMETYAIAEIMAEKEFAKLPFTAIRVVDDLPGEENYLIKEKMLREMTATTPSGKPRWRDIWAFGVWDYVRITARRHAVARAIFDAVNQA